MNIEDYRDYCLSLGSDVESKKYSTFAANFEYFVFEI